MHNEQQWGLRLDDIIAKRRQELRGQSEQERLSPFKAHPLSKQERIDRVFDKNCQKAFFWFAKNYYPEYVTHPFAEFHYELIKFARSRNKEFHLIAGPPEHGKSIIFMIWKVFIGITGYRHLHAQIGEDKTLAKANLSWVKQEFQYNFRIRHDFGDLMHPLYKSKSFFAVKNYKYDERSEFDNPYTAYKAFGHNTTLRGTVFYQYRIDSVELDDYEPYAKSRNPDLVDERIKWLFSEVMGRVSEKGVVYWIHNNSRKNSAADSLHNDEERSKLFSHIHPCLIGKKPLWAQRYSHSDLQATRRQVGYSTWMGDWMQEPIVEGKIFKPEYIKTFDAVPLDLIIVARLDPSISKSGDYKALIALGWSPKTKRFYIVDAWVRQTTPAAMVNASYLMYEDWQDRGLRSIKIEDDFKQSFIYNPHFLNVADQKGYRLPISTFETEGVAKKDRIMVLESPMELGLILFPEGYKKDPDFAELVNQIMAFDYGSSSSHDDGPDALATCYKELDKVARSYRFKNSNKYEAIEKGQPKRI